MNIDFIITLVQFIVVFGLLLFFHEFGHFITARLFKINVEEFGFGFPPRLAKLFTWRRTEFTLNWIPFGAFVRLQGENDAEVEGGFSSAKPFPKLAVLAGGPLMNLLVGVLVYAILFAQIGVPNQQVVLVAQIDPQSPAETAGLQPNDVITAINGTKIDSIEKLQTIVNDNLGKSINLEYTRNNSTATVDIVPRVKPPTGAGPLGIGLEYPYEKTNIISALPSAVGAAYSQIQQLILMPVRLIEGQISPQDARVVGPVGIFDMYQEVRQRDIQTTATQPNLPAVNVLGFIGLISVALGFTNLLPIPALDGGRILFVLPELLFKKRVPPQYENLVNLIGFAALLLFLGYVTLQDIINPIVFPH